MLGNAARGEREGAWDKADSVVDRVSYFHLSKQWWFALLLGAVLVIAGCGLLFYCYPSRSPLRGGVQIALIVTYILYILRRYLWLNTQGSDQQLRSSLGPANWATLARGGLIAFLAGFLFQFRSARPVDSEWIDWIPGAVYLTAVVGDALDGFIARATATQTQLGELLDTRIDALGVLVACLLAIHYGQLPGYYISAGLAYYLLRFAIWLRKKTGRPCAEIQRRCGARLMAGSQMVFLAIVLLPLFSPQLTHTAAVFILIPFLAGFLLDWQMVCRHDKFVKID